MSTNEEAFRDEPMTIIRLLKTEGLIDTADDIYGVYIGGSTGNEIISGIYFHLRQVDLSKLSDTTSKRIESYLQFLSKNHPKLCWNP